MQIRDIEIRIEKLKAKARKFVRGYLTRALKRVQDPTIDKKLILSTLTNMVHQGKATVSDVIKVEIGEKLSFSTRADITAFLAEEGWKKPMPLASTGGVLLCQSTTGLAVPNPPRKPPLKGSKAREQQAQHMAHRSCRYYHNKSCNVCNPNKLSPKTLKALKKSLRLE